MINNLLRDWKCDVVCLQETKVAKMDLGMVRSLWSNPYLGWVALNAVNTAGGIVLMWDKRILERIENEVGTFSVSCRWKGISDGFEWACSGIYGPNLDGIKSAMWGELSDVKQRWNVPWCAIGDFNVVCFPSERLGCESFGLSMSKFSDWIDHLNLVDLPLIGGTFMWCNGAILPRCPELIELWFHQIGRITFRM